MTDEQFPFPEHIYIPGLTLRHDEGFLDHVKQVTPDVTQDQTASKNAGWLYGLRLIRAGYFWEAHEVLETVWLRAKPNGRERQLVQGVIHLTNAGLKDVMERKGAAERLFQLAEVCFKEAYTGWADGPLMLLRKSELDRVVAARSCEAFPEIHIP